MDTKNDYFTIYTRLSKWLTRYPRLVRFLRWFNRAAVLVMYLAYLGVLLTVLFQHWSSPLRAIASVAPFLLVPGAGFAVLTLVRHLLNRPRPYDEWAIDPLIPREKHGDSFPSRHVFSATVISLTAWRLSWPAGLLFLLITFLLAAVRVIGGVHYLRDVVAGVVCGLGCGACLWLF